MNRKLFVALITCSIMESSAFADEISYRNVSVGFLSGDISEQNITGLSLKGSVDLSRNIFIRGAYNRYDLKSLDLDSDRYLLGVGYHRKLTNKIDFETSLAYVAIKNEFNNNKNYEASFGLRSKPFNQLEVGLQALYVDGDTQDGEVGYKFSSRWIATDTLSFGILYRVVDEVNAAVFDIGIGF